MNTFFKSIISLIVSASLGLSQYKSEDGFYIVVNFVPPECKAKFEGYYQVSKELRISLPHDNIEISVDKNTELIREDLHEVIKRYCHQEMPERLAIPVINIINVADVKKAGDGVMVMGRVKRPGWIPMQAGLTVFGATQAAGGINEFSTIRDVSIIREGKVIQCDFRKAEQSQTLLNPGDLIYVPLRCPVSETGY